MYKQTVSALICSSERAKQRTRQKNHKLERYYVSMKHADALSRAVLSFNLTHEDRPYSPRLLSPLMRGPSS